MTFPFALVLTGMLLISACGSGKRSWQQSSLTADGWSDSDYQLSQQESARLKREAYRAQQAGDREVCGAILQREDGSLELCFADNESLHAHSYQLSSRSVKRMTRIAEATGSTIIGSFHSHPTSDARPGPGDLKTAGVLSLMLIHSVRTGETRLWKVVLRDGRKQAREVMLRVHSQRTRGPSPLAPSRSEPIPDYLKHGGLQRDLRTTR